jgi:dienelactone hydrolase
MTTPSNSIEVSIELPEKIALKGLLAIPKNATTIVVFAHGSGSGRHSPRNQFVARAFAEEGLATLLLDLLTPQEESIDIETREYRFDIPLLAKRLSGATSWLEKNKTTHHLKVAYFGSSTGAAAALIAASQLDNKIAAVVSRGGRPDLAAASLPHVQAPTLLIVGGRDAGVIELNKEALELLPGTKKLEIVPGATHLFEEPGTLEEVARLAAAWFKTY